VFGGMGQRGDAIAEVDGVPVYVSGMLPGERARIRVRKRYRAMAVADVVELLEPSPHRRVPPCPHFGPCGGCQLQHVSDAHQLELKRELVIDHLRQGGGFADPPVEPVLACEPPWAYRNHARFTVDPGTGAVGFVQQRPKRHLPITRCMLMDPRIDAVLQQVQGRLRGATQINVRVGTRTGELSVQPALDLRELGIATGQTHLHEQLHGRTFRIANPSFFQVNTRQAERLIDVVRDHLALDGTQLLVDAYAGVGTFAAILAPHCAQVIAIEESGPAVEDARHNLADLANVEIKLGRSEAILLDMAREGVRVDAMVLDPSRAGCHPAALEAVLTLRPRRLAYVSCDPESLARDLHTLCHAPPAGLAPLELVRVQPVDMFPHTRHIEAVASLRDPALSVPAAAGTVAG
jgi:23S rRNA (uracil1939-C5)-methyltransferase